MNLHLPSVKTDATLPAKGDGAGAVDFPRYTEVPIDQSNSGADLGSRILNYIGLARKHKYLIIVVVAIFMFGGVIETMLTPKIYSASTTIKIDRSVPTVFKSRAAEAEFYETGFYQTQYELIRSRVLAERVATALDLGQSDFLGHPQPSLLKRLFRRDSDVAPIPNAIDVKARQAIAAGVVMGGLSVLPVGESSIVRIRYSALDPAWAQRISIAVAEQYEKLILDMREAGTTHARNFLQERLDELKLKLEESEKQLIQYARKEGIVDVDNKQPQVATELQTVQAAYSNAVTARIQLEETWRQAQADDVSSLPQVMSDALIQSERTKLAELRATYQDKLATLKPAFPEMIALKNEISATENDIHTQVNLNLHLPNVKTGATLPTKGDGAGAVDFPRYTEVPLDQSDSGTNLGSRILNYIGLARKHKYLIIVVVAIFMFGGIIETMLTPKIYSASTTIKIDRSVPTVFKGQTAEAGTYYEIGFYQTQYELIRSRALAERVATALDLGQSDFLGHPQPSLLKRLFRRDSDVAPIPDAIDVKARQAIAAGAVMGGLSVQPVGESSIVRIRYSALDPAWAQRISIAVAEQYEKLTLDMRDAATTHARNFLQERLDELRLKLEESEKQLIQYARKEGIVDVDNKQPQVATELQTVQAAYSNAVTARIQLEETWRQAQADDVNSLPQVMSDALIQSERTKLAELRATYQDKLATLKPAFPEMIALKNEISETENDIHTQIARIKGSINQQYQAVVANEKALNDKLSELKGEALDLRSRSVNYTILMREVDTNRSLYDGVLQQYRELGVASDARNE